MLVFSVLKKVNHGEACLGFVGRTTGFLAICCGSDLVLGKYSELFSVFI